MTRLLYIFILLTLTLQGQAQSWQESPITIASLLQYEQSKARSGEAFAPFSQYGFKRIYATEVLSSDDTRRLWGYHVGANLDFDKDKDPLYKLFALRTMGSMAVIDDVSSRGKCRVIFWSKRLYHRFEGELEQLHFELATNKHTNKLLFTRAETSVRVVVTITPDLYLMDIEPTPQAGNIKTRKP